MDGRRALLVLAGAVSVTIAALPWLALEQTPSLSLGGLRLCVLEPRWLSLCALSPWLLRLSGRGAQPLAGARVRGTTVLRGLGLVALSLALARPALELPESRNTTVFVVDVSRSRDDLALRDTQRTLAELLQRSADRPVAVLRFAGRAEPVSPPSAERAVQRFAEDEASDLENALSSALGLLEPGLTPQLVLFSDGRETAGSLTRACALLRRRGVPLRVVPQHTKVPYEVAVTELASPPELRAGEPFALRARVFASAPGQARVRLTRLPEDTLVEPERELWLPSGETELSFQTTLKKPGTTSFRLTLTPRGADRLRENNLAEHEVSVRGSPRVMYVEREPERASALRALLESAGFVVELRAAEHAPRSEDALDAVVCYIVSDLSPGALSEAAARTLARYVERGGTVLFAGGERGLSPLHGTPEAALLPLLAEPALRREEPTLALVLALDKSGSMVGEKLERAKQAALATAELVGGDNYLGVIAFDAEPERVLRLAVHPRPSGALRALLRVTAGGGTAIFPALDLAYAELASVRARIKHVLLLTDGQTANEPLAPLARNMFVDGITLSAVGLGEDVNRGLLSELARSGGGRAYFTRDASSVPRLFLREAELVLGTSSSEVAVGVRVLRHAAFMQGVDFTDAPPLRGFVRSRPRAEAETLLATSEGPPLLARMRVGEGWSLAFTSDLKPRWALPWFSWAAFPRLLAQLLRAHQPKLPPSIAPLELELRHDSLLARVEARTSGERFESALTGRVELHGPAGRRESAELLVVAPGRYEARFLAPQVGTYKLEARLSPAASESPAIVARGSVSRAFPAEYAPPFAPDLRGLAACAESSGGDLLERPSALHEKPGRPVMRLTEGWPLLVALALALFLLDVAVRRLPERLRAPRGGLGT